MAGLNIAIGRFNFEENIPSATAFVYTYVFGYTSNSLKKQNI